MNLNNNNQDKSLDSYSTPNMGTNNSILGGQIHEYRQNNKSPVNDHNNSNTNPNYSYSNMFKSGEDSESNVPTFTYPISSAPKKKRMTITYAKFIFILSIVLIVAVLLVGGRSLFGTDNPIDNDKDPIINAGQTVIIADNVYKDVNLRNREDAVNLIILDSDTQKEKCTNEEIKKIERRLEVKHKIIAVNLCEMDEDFALELESTINKVFSDFPTIKGYLTNVTLNNAKDDESYIAAFTATQLFATSNTIDTYPHAYKMVMNLNTKYFLNADYLESTVLDASIDDYFPKGASRSSVVAHEFGHYISFVSLLRSTFLDDTLLLTKDNYQKYLNLVNSWNRGDFSQKIIKEAYNNYRNNYHDSISEYEFRASISTYAVATDINGNFIYDETIAEAFHDNYLNGNNAKPASKEIIKVLRKYMNGSIS